MTEDDLARFILASLILVYWALSVSIAVWIVARYRRATDKAREVQDHPYLKGLLRACQLSGLALAVLTVVPTP